MNNNSYLGNFKRRYYGNFIIVIIYITIGLVVWIADRIFNIGIF